MKPIVYKEFNDYKRHAFFLSDIESEYQYKKEIKKSKKVINPHDKIFKEVLDMKEEAVKFLNKNLGLENTKYALIEEEIEKYNRSFITSEFRYIQSDVIYKKKNQNIFFLIEHQSKIDYSMPYRILKYNMEIIESALDIAKVNSKMYKLPTVYTFVIYTGGKKWDANQYVLEKQERLQGAPREVFGNFRVIDINDYTKEELLKNEDLLSDMMLLEKAKAIEELESYLREIVRKKVNHKQKIFIQRLVEYILKSKIQEETYNQFVKMLKNEEGEEFMFVKILGDWVEEKFGALEEREQEVVQKEEKVAQKEEKVAQKEEKVAQKEEKVAQKEEKVAQKEEEVAQKEEKVAQKEEKVAQKEKEIIEKKEEIINQIKDNMIIEMLKNKIDDKVIIQIAKIKPNELAKIKRENQMVLANL
ncbi:MAG: hypothetical protein HFJ37_05815 [Clostridia bacterium]|nr:hypothetical protein [Clostridia bacterium]